MVRSTEVTTEEVSLLTAGNPKGNEWCADLDQKTAEFIQSLANQSIPEELAQVSEAEQKEQQICEEARATFISSNFSEYKYNGRISYRCSLCGKHFNEPSFVEKHIPKLHAYEMKVMCSKEVLLQLVRSDYLKNTNAKIPRVISKIPMKETSSNMKEMRYKMNAYGKSEERRSFVANKYIDRDAMSSMKVDAKKSVASVFDDFFTVCFSMLARGGKIRFLSGVKSLSLLRCQAASCLRDFPIPLVQVRGYKNHKEDPLYVPFATDAERELASIRFWVSKNTNLKEVNVNCRV